MHSHSGMVAPRRREVADLGQEPIDGDRLRRLFLLRRRLRQSEQSADLLLQDVELPSGDGEAVVGRGAAHSCRAAAAVEVDRQPGAGDGIAEFVGESSRQLAKQPLPLTGDK